MFRSRSRQWRNYSSNHLSTRNSAKMITVMSQQIPSW